MSFKEIFQLQNASQTSLLSKSIDDSVKGNPNLESPTREWWWSRRIRRTKL